MPQSLTPSAAVSGRLATRSFPLSGLRFAISRFALGCRPRTMADAFQAGSFRYNVLQCIYPVQTLTAGFVHQAIEQDAIRRTWKSLLKKLTDPAELGRDIFFRRLVSFPCHSLTPPLGRLTHATRSWSVKTGYFFLQAHFGNARESRPCAFL